MKISEHLQNVGRAIAYHPKLKRLFGSCAATIFFEQIFYWSDKGSSSDGWIYKTAEEIEEETALSYKEQKTARKHLVSLGVLQEDYKRLDHKMYFKINNVALDELYEKAFSENSPTDQSAVREDTNRQFGNDPTGSSFKEQKITSEITHKTTNNIYTPISRKQQMFEEFWQVYPRKVGKGAARKAFNKIKVNNDLLKEILQAIEAQKKGKRWLEEGGKYIPNPSTWLNQERWADEVEIDRKLPISQRELLDI